MYAFIKGTLVRIAALEAIVENNGIGYHVMVPANALGRLPQIGGEVLLYTSFVVREQSHTLYGFVKEEEKRLFESLTSVSGVGPKLALSLIGHLNLEELHEAISAKDARVIAKVPGIGKKTAERLIIELDDKLPGDLFGINPSSLAIQVESDPMKQTIHDAMSALIHLGYNQVTAQKAIKKSLEGLEESPTLSSVITEALNHV